MKSLFEQKVVAMVGVEGHRDLVDLKMCSKINTQFPFVYTQQAAVFNYITHLLLKHSSLNRNSIEDNYKHQRASNVFQNILQLELLYTVTCKN